MTSIKTWVGIGFPKLVNRTPEEIDQTFYHRILQGLLVGGLIAAAYIFISPYIFKYLLPQYLDSIHYSQLLAIVLVFALPNRYVSLLLEAHKFSRLILWNSTVLSALRVALFISLGVWGGILGLIYAHIFVSGIGLLVNIGVWRFRKR